MIQDGQHLLNCLRYVDLNMVRAGVVHHPREWDWCGYHELTGRRKRYRILDLEHLAERSGLSSVEALRTWYAERVEERLVSGPLKREGHWSDALAVGGEAFVAAIQGRYRRRTQFSVAELDGGVWQVREEPPPYSTEKQS